MVAYQAIRTKNTAAVIAAVENNILIITGLPFHHAGHFTHGHFIHHLHHAFHLFELF